MDSLDSFYGVRPTETVPVTFEWRHRATTVSVTGDFINWGPGLEMKHEDGRFVLTIRFRPGQTVHYKFIVDGEWTLNSDLPVESDAAGNSNHVLRIGEEQSGSKTPSTPAAIDHFATVGKRSDGRRASETRRASFDGSPVLAPMGFGGYIGAGVHREYKEEYNLEVQPRSAKSGMVRSVSLADVGSLNLQLLQPWGKGAVVPDKGGSLAGRAKGGAVGARGLVNQQKPAPLVTPPSEPVYEFAATLDLGVPASPALKVVPVGMLGGESTPKAAAGRTPTAAAALGRAGSGTALNGLAAAGRTGSGSSVSGSMGPKVPSMRAMASLGSGAAAAAAAGTATTTTMTTVQDSLRREGKLVLSMVSEWVAHGGITRDCKASFHLTWPCASLGWAACSGQDFYCQASQAAPYVDGIQDGNI
jgi:hypothetical protein